MRLPWNSPEPGRLAVGIPAGDEAGGEQACLSLSRVLERVQNVDKPFVLDLGPFSGPSAVFLAGIGARVTVEDFDPPPALRAESDDVPPPFRLDFPDDSFHVVLGWETLDFTPRCRLDEVGAEIVRVMRPGGALLLFNSGRTVEPASPMARGARFKILAADRIERQPVADLTWPRHTHQARAVEQAIAPLSILGSHLQRNQTRETIAVKRQS